MKNLNLLIIDNEPDIREVFSLTFELDGHKTFTASNAAEAIDIVKNNNIDFIISEMYMPGIKGLQLLEEMHKYSPSTPVVVLFSGATNISREEALEKGAIEFLSKPPNLDEIIDLIEKHARN